MLHQWYKTRFSNVIAKSPSVLELFERIRESQIQHEKNEYLNRLIFKCLYLLFIIFVICFLQYHNRIYNAWAGPFHLNLDEFINYWKVYSGNVSKERSFLSSLVLFDKENLQIELGEDKIDDNPKHVYGVYYRHPIFEKLLYTFNPIKEQSIANAPMQLLIKLPTNLQSHFHKRLPYHFELFNSKTLKCIAQQIDISPELYQSNFERSTHIKMIEDIYDQNATDFNVKVITKCGILLGYLYDCQNEPVFTWYSNQSYQFTSLVAAFDASSSYSPYMSYLCGSILFLWCLRRAITIIVDLFLFYWQVFGRSQLVIYRDVQHLLNRFQIDSLEMLDYLLMRTIKENNYGKQLFLLQAEHLIIFKIKVNERDPKILNQFSMTIPFTIVSIASIREINSKYISISNAYHVDKIPLPKIGNNNNDVAEWLHERLMNYSVDYRYCYEQKHFCEQQEAIRVLERQNLYRLTTLINEEEEIQRNNYEHDLERIWNREVSASPRFIARFRLEGGQIVNNQQFETICVICQDALQLGDHYSQWPCLAQHTFHYNCMLNALRRQNRCPLCRDAVEAGNLPPIEVAFRSLLSGIGSRATS